MAVRRAVFDRVRIIGQLICYPFHREMTEVFEFEFAAWKKGCGFMLTYPVIDVQKTGKHLKMECERRQVTPREIQEFLGLAALQSVYGWFQGRTLPSLDNFYALSCFLGMRMEEMVVPKRREKEVVVRDALRSLERRMMAYLGFCFQAEGAGAEELLREQP